MKCSKCGQEIPYEVSQAKLEEEIRYASKMASKWKCRLEELRGEKEPKTYQFEYGYTYILEALKNGGKTQAEIARFTFKAKSSVSRGIAKLEAQNKVKKDKDGKYWLVSG